MTCKKALHIAQGVAATMNRDHKSLPLLLNSLAYIYRLRFERLSTYEDLKASLDIIEDALSLSASSPNDQDRHLLLFNLAGILQVHFERTKEEKDIQRAVLCTQEVVDSTRGIPDSVLRLEVWTN